MTKLVDPPLTKEPLKDHAAFFDPDGDDVIWLNDTYEGIRKLGFSVVFSFALALGIHLGLSWFTWDTWLPDPFLRMRPSKMVGGLHRSDTRVFRPGGGFDEERFEFLWNKVTAPPHETMNYFQLLLMIFYDTELFDILGVLTALGEWTVTFFMLQNKGAMAKADVKGMYGGTTFAKVAERNAAKKST